MNDAYVRGARSLSLSIVSRLRRFAFIFQWLRGGAGAKIRFAGSTQYSFASCVEILKYDNRSFASPTVGLRSPMFFRRCSTATGLLLIGVACLIVAMLTHVAERLQVFTFMGWGQPDSAGHYLDLTSAILGCTLLAVGLLATALDRLGR